MLLITIRKRMCSLYLSAQKSATSRNIKKFCGLYLQNTLRRDLSRYVFVKKCAILIDKQQKERYNNVVIDNDVII